eukprot:366045-Chlamydomonas_euryale.AAC.20
MQARHAAHTHAPVPPVDCCTGFLDATTSTPSAVNHNHCKEHHVPGLDLEQEDSLATSCMPQSVAQH